MAAMIPGRRRGFKPTLPALSIFGVFADIRQDLPRPRAFGADGFFDHHGNAGNALQAKRLGRRLALAHFVIRGDADLGQIDIEQRVENRFVRNVNQRRGLQRRSDPLGGPLDFQRAGDDATDVADGFPLGGQGFVLEFFQAFREQRQMHRRFGVGPVHPPCFFRGER
jgi:hypothetical protein